MECPSCNRDFDMTWRLYVRNVRGRFACPLCGARLRGRHNKFYWLGLAIFLVLELGVGLLLMLALGTGIGIAATVLVMLAVGLPLDKYLESRFAVLRLDQRGDTRPTSAST